MFRFRRSSLSDVLRVAAAALVLLAGIATARMQGAAGGALFAQGPGAVLCSGTLNPEAPDGGSAAHVHGSCVLCQIAGTPAPGIPAMPVRFSALWQQEPVLARAPEGATGKLYQARGPPRIG